MCFLSYQTLMSFLNVGFWKKVGGIIYDDVLSKKKASQLLPLCSKKGDVVILSHRSFPFK